MCSWECHAKILIIVLSMCNIIVGIANGFVLGLTAYDVLPEYDNTSMLWYCIAFTFICHVLHIVAVIYIKRNNYDEHSKLIAHFICIIGATPCFAYYISEYNRVISKKEYELWIICQVESLLFCFGIFLAIPRILRWFIKHWNNMCEEEIDQIEQIEGYVERV